MTISIQGSILNYRDFSRTLNILLGVKLQKLQARHEKYDDKTATLADMVGHLIEEVEELTQEIPGRDRQAIYKELADVSNCVDIIFYMLQKTSDLSQPHIITPD